MTTIAEFMTALHRKCDEGLAAAEEAVSSKDWDKARADWSDFAAEMALHFAQEETTLFPSFETATGITEGPTSVMRMEHEQMRHLLSELSKAVEARDESEFLGLSETLMVMIQQHNMKEEQMLYPMCDRALSDAGAIIAEIQAVTADGE
ncbi:MAG: hemerythrin domain-containing protein [Myxococcota bacterium]|jgi:hemerythrin-like domain-containing protein|nr:hemerythrin domain-containing protein [Myxococcota bacterium]